jgi:transketolase
MRKTPGLDMTTGSLGQGLSAALGMALGSRHLGSPFEVYALLSDGELQEGMIWEAAMAAAHYRVGNLTALVDCNGLQVDGLVHEVMSIEPLAQKWRAFGWRVLEVDGNDVPALLRAFDQRRAEAADEPWVLLCRTVKGKGVSFMEGVMEWHASPITPDQREEALRQLAVRSEPMARDQLGDEPAAHQGTSAPERAIEERCMGK